MTRYFLSCAKIEGFRGINNEGDPLTVKFKTDAVNSIFAANGLGKSSLFEAISFALTGTVPKLDRMVAAESAKEYYCNKFHTKRRAEIVPTFSPDDGTRDVEIKVVREASGKKIVTSPSGYPTPELLLAALADETVLRDQQTFVKFLLDSPLDRGKAFSSLLGLSKLAEVRQGLSAVANTTAFNTDSNIKVLEMQVTLSGNQLLQTKLALKQDYLGLIGTPLAEPIDPVRAATEAVQALASVALLQPLCTNVTLDKVDFAKISSTIKTAEGSEEQERLKRIIGDIAVLEGLAPLAAEVGERSALLDLCRAKDTALATTKGPPYMNSTRL
jgi:DNA repair exonuclease SbcCD ATPase subunit